MAENQEQMKLKEREIPVFTVLKNNSILKNIFILDNPPPISPTSSVFEAGNGNQELELEEELLVGRHPDCNIKLEHPSISRFHLRIQSKPSSRSLFVTDLSSVHGTCVSGKRIEPGVKVELVQGDTLKLGESSRLYRLDWVPISFAYDINDSFVPQMAMLNTADEETEGSTDQDENSLPRGNEREQCLSDKMEGLGLSMQEMAIEAPMHGDLCRTFPENDEEEKSRLRNRGNETSSSHLCTLDVSFTLDEGTNGMKNQDGDHLLHRNDEGIGLSEIVEDLEQPSCDEDLSVSMQKMSTTIPSLPESEVENTDLLETCEKENESPSSSLFEIEHQPESRECSEMNSQKRVARNIWSRRSKSECVETETSRSKANCARIKTSSPVKPLLDNDYENRTMLKDQYSSPDKDNKIFTPDKKNASPSSCLVRSLGSRLDEALKSRSISNATISCVDEDEETFTPDKENMTPNSYLRRSFKNVGSSQEVIRSNLHKQSPLKTTSNSNYREEVTLPSPQQGTVLQELTSTSSDSKSCGRLREQPYVSKKSEKRVPFLSLPVVSTSDAKSAPIPSVQVAPCSKYEGVNHSHSWTIVVDISCLLNKKSRRELQLLRGLRGTSLVIPRIVLRELDCMVRRARFLSRMTDASAALQWIEECMASTKWWIHVQSSSEESRLVPPTPPAAASAHWFGEDKGSFPVSHIPFSPYTLQEIITPTATDHILESALFFKQTKIGQFVLLSEDVTLKIKAMAEGVICETAKEFRASLVNPFSARFLYSNSSPRGPTWTCLDDTVLKEKYYPSPSKKTARSGDGAKGLKLILLHNSNFRPLRV